MSDDTTTPPISVVVLAANDRPFIRDCLDDLRAQRPAVAEVVVVDTGCIDGTADVARAAGVRVVAQPDEVHADRVCVARARARYSPDAVATWVAGRRAAATTVGTTSFGRAAAAVARWLPALRHPAGELDGRVFAPDSASELARTCMAAARTAPAALPAGLVAAAAIGAVAGRGWRRVGIPLLHAVACGAVAARVSKQRGITAHRAFAALEVGHWSSGVASLGGLAARSR